MSSDPLQLLSQLLQNRGQNSQTLAVSGTANQLQSSQGVVSSGGPNASQRFQVANSNINHTTYNFYLGNSFGAIANGDHGAYPNHQPTVTSYIRPSMIEAADQEDLNAKLAAIKESTVGVRKSTEELKEFIVKFAETTDKLSEWITALNWPNFKLSMNNEVEIALGDLSVEPFEGLLRLRQLTLEACRSNVEHGESIVRDSDSVISTMTVGESISLDVFDALTSKLREVAAACVGLRQRGNEPYTRQVERINRSYTDFNEKVCELDSDDYDNSRFKVFREAYDCDMFEETCKKEWIECHGVCTTLNGAFRKSMIAYAESLGAPDDVIAAFMREDE